MRNIKNSFKKISDYELVDSNANIPMISWSIEAPVAPAPLGGGKFNP
jgi:hypothetical protein